MTKLLLRAAAVIAVLAIAVYAAFQLSPWPSALLIRFAFDRGGEAASAALEKHVPPGIAAQFNLQYDPADSDAYLDVFYPADIDGTDRALRTIVWIHGGGWISGSKEQIANYARILAGQGFTVVGVDYSIAPGSTYPKPLRQLNAALAYLQANAMKLHIDPRRFVLAGDSAGAHIAAQMANIISVPSCAQAVGIAPSIERSKLLAVLLHCGPYKIRKGEGIKLGDFSRVLLWSYSGREDFNDDPSFATASVIDYITAEFPPVFISAGNADPLLPHSLAMSAALTGLGVRVDALFYPADYEPPLPHEYQFNLDTEAGRLALERSVGFLNGL
ncbi:MAG: alpha/beta hydrolase [Dongiaceae bacterium]